MADKPVLGVVVGNRAFFPDKLVEAGRTQMLQVLHDLGCETVCLTPEDTNLGGVENLEEARKCAALFDAHRHEIDGILVTLPNFGDEKAIANALRWADLDVPVLVHAFPDDIEKMDRENRRDAFCGKMSVCNNLVQYGIPFSLTASHVEAPDTSAFARDVRRFTAVCRVVKGLRGARLGALGARTGPFNTVRFSERLLEAEGISVETLDLSDLFRRMDALDDDAPEVRERLKRLSAYAQSDACSEEVLERMARFQTAVEDWVRENEIVALALQCWTSIEEQFGMMPCGVMSLLSETRLPCACEVDVMGALAMYALQLASGRPSAIVDWNNNYGDDPDCAVLFHCSNLPQSCFRRMSMGLNAILADTLGPEYACGVITGVLREGPVTFARLHTDDTAGEITGYVGEGRILVDEPATFGGVGAMRVRDLQGLLHFICRSGFEHHVALNYGQVADILDEAFTTYYGWDIHRHE